MRKHPVCMLLALVFVLGFALPLAAEEAEEGAAPVRSEEAIEILKKVDAAIKQVSAVRYSAKTEPSGAATNFISAGEGTAVLVGWNGQIPEKFYMEIKTERQGQPVELTAGGDGDTYFLIDHTAKKAYEDMDPAVMGSSANALFSFAVLEFVHDAPFDDELNADTIEYLGTETVGGSDCHKVHVIYAGGQGESTWYFSQDGFLPLRRIVHFSTPQGDGSMERTLRDVQVDPKIDESLFVMQLPEGYERIDDFAP